MGLTNELALRVECKRSAPPLVRINATEVPLCVPVCVCEGESCVCLCAKLHCMQVESLKMIVLRHSLCPIRDVGGEGWKCNNDDVQSFCVYKRAL